MVMMVVMVTTMGRWDDANEGSRVMMMVVMVVTHANYNLSDLRIVSRRR
jgi:hypothetical protein